MKIVILDGYTLNPGDLSWDSLRSLGEVTVYNRTTFDAKDEAIILERIGDAEIVFTNKTPLSRNVIDKMPKVKYIGVLATGYNVVDIQAAKEKGIVVTNIPNYGTEAVAQMVFALLLEICHHVGAHNEAVKAGQWSTSKDFCFWNYPLIELLDKTIGIIGYGSIGESTARIAQAFGMKVLAYKRTPNKELETDRLTFVELDELLAKSDVISLHCPLTESNHGMINKNSIAKMKDSVIIINTARGPLINEQDLADALETGKVAGAAVDVVSLEPISPENPLMKTDKCIITPHIAWAPKETRARLLGMAVENLQAFLDGQPVNVVNI